MSVVTASAVAARRRRRSRRRRATELGHAASKVTAAARLPSPTGRRQRTRLVGTAVASGSGSWSRPIILSDGAISSPPKLATPSGKSVLDGIVFARGHRGPAARCSRRPRPAPRSPRSSTLTGTAESGTTVELFENRLLARHDGPRHERHLDAPDERRDRARRPTTPRGPVTFAGNISAVWRPRPDCVSTAARRRDTTIGSVTTGANSSFAFSSTKSGTFQCRLDGPGSAVGSLPALHLPEDLQRASPPATTSSRCARSTLAGSLTDRPPRAPSR